MSYLMTEKGLKISLIKYQTLDLPWFYKERTLESILNFNIHGKVSDFFIRETRTPHEMTDFKTTFSKVTVNFYQNDRYL